VRARARALLIPEQTEKTALWHNGKHN